MTETQGWLLVGSAYLGVGVVVCDMIRVSRWTEGGIVHAVMALIIILLWPLFLVVALFLMAFDD